MDVESLRTFLNSLSGPEQEAFAKRCGTSVGYIRKAMSTGQRFRESLVILFERESKGEVLCEELRPDVDWGYVRGSLSSLQINSVKRA